MIKKDFHVHLYGTLRPIDLWEIGREQEENPLLSWYADEYQKAWGRLPDVKSYWEKADGLSLLAQDYLVECPITFAQFQACFNLIIALCPPSPQGRVELSERVIRHVHAQKVEYLEARTLIPVRFSAETAYEFLLRSCKKVLELNTELGNETRLVFSLFRDNALAEQHYTWIREFIEKHPDLGEAIVGIDFAYTEEGFPPSDKRRIFQKFREDNQKKKPLLLLYHVGESFSDKSMASAIRWIFEAQKLGTHRLGHATALGLAPENYAGEIRMESAEEYAEHWKWLHKEAHILEQYGYNWKNFALFYPEPTGNPISIHYSDLYLENIRTLQKAVAAHFRSTPIIIESCPTSNLYIGQIKKKAFHPLKFFHTENLSYVLGTDDPGIFNCDWVSEAKLAKEITGS